MDGLETIAAEEIVGETIHVSYFPRKGIHQHIEEGHFTASGIKIGSIEKKVSVLFGS